MIDINYIYTFVLLFILCNLIIKESKELQKHTIKHKKDNCIMNFNLLLLQ